MQKARRHIPKNAPTACRHAVSCTISLPFRGTISPFPHGTSPLSVTREYSGLPGGPGRFTADSTSPLLLGSALHNVCRVFAYGALTHYGNPFQRSSANTTHHHQTSGSPSTNTSHNPSTAKPAGMTRPRFSHHPLSLATTHGITIVFSSCGY